MVIILTPIEARVLGSLLEKEMSTPDYYPLTLNALTNACNQRSNREPVMNLDDKTVVRAIENLRKKHLICQKNMAESRVPKYAHDIQNLFKFSLQELAVLCDLLLRGPQTIGEIRIHAGRLFEFNDISEVEATLQGLIDREDGPFIVKLPRQAGRRECRYAHLLCGEVKTEEESQTHQPEAVTLEVRSENERIGELEQKVATMQSDLEELKQEFIRFMKQFE